MHDAIAFRQRLLQAGHYTSDKLDPFASYVHHGGAKQCVADTFAGFVLAASPCAVSVDEAWQDYAARHYYEVILVNHPCWLCFDLENLKKAKPTVEPVVVMDAFYLLLGTFCYEVFGMMPDTSTVLELELPTDKTFSRHVIVKQMLLVTSQDGAQPSPPQRFAFDSNAHVGVFSGLCLEYNSSKRL